MKIWTIISLIFLVLFAVVILIVTFTEAGFERKNCEQFRFTVIQDVPKACFEYFKKEFK